MHQHEWKPIGLEHFRCGCGEELHGMLVDPRNAFTVEITMYTEDARRYLDPEKVRFIVAEGLERYRRLAEEIDFTVVVRRSMAS